MLFDFESGKWSKWLTEPAGAVSYPVWSADSKSIYFDDLVTDEESIRSVNVGSSEVETSGWYRWHRAIPGHVWTLGWTHSRGLMDVCP